MRKSRRWLFASMGASAVAAAGCTSAQGKDSPGAGRTLPTPTDCEKALATTIPGLNGWLSANPTDPTKKELALGDVVEYGFGYNYIGLPGGLPNFKSALLTHLENAYKKGIAEANAMPWKMSVAQAFILGQLTFYFWRKAATADLHFRHLASAWAVFGRATSSCWCVEWVVDADPKSRNAYVLPLLTEASPAGEIRVSQLDEPCALCN